MSPRVPGSLSPRANQLLAALPPDDYERLLPELEPVPLPLDRTLHVGGARENALTFVGGGIVARYHVTLGGASAEFAVTGSEGVIGVASFLSGARMPGRAVVLCPGHGFRVDADRLKSSLEHDGPLPQLLLRYVQALITQTGLTAVCNRHHSLDQRLSRWVLSCLDRLPGNELAMTQERIAEMLGVRREGVTEAVGRLERAGLIHCGRGHIVVLDRRRMEARACECYAVVKHEYERLLRPGMPAAEHAHRAFATPVARSDRRAMSDRVPACAHAP
jgi:CRP-like cAMP-binding protein